uniref:translation initiation factor 1 n=1 Tax=Physocarpus amurensis TaxID=190008 RepID=UPI0021AC17A6|nr:translation initiation factor 1 [Physocarpus amurensis]UUB71060.1 translation initiation factor 1 [Physocarpus amurensis]
MVCIFWGRLDNENLIRGFVSERIRRSFIRILPGNRIKIEVSPYDSTKGRIIYRLQSKESNDRVVFSISTFFRGDTIKS